MIVTNIDGAPVRFLSLKSGEEKTLKLYSALGTGTDVVRVSVVRGDFLTKNPAGEEEVTAQDNGSAIIVSAETLGKFAGQEYAPVGGENYIEHAAMAPDEAVEFTLKVASNGGFSAVGLGLAILVGRPSSPFIFDAETNTITGYLFEIGGPEVVMPSEIDGVAVKHIGDNVFTEMAITSLTLPEGLLTIGNNSFSFCSLMEITLPETLTSIGDAAFTGNAFTSLVIPDSVANMGFECFSQNQISSLTIGAGITSIPDGAFKLNVISGSLSLPAGLTSIGRDAFLGNQITDVTISDSVTSLGDGCLRQNSISSVTFGSGLSAIPMDALKYNQLSSIAIPANINQIGFNAFSDNQIASAYIPATVTTLDYSCLDNNQTTPADLTVYSGIYGEAFLMAMAKEYTFIEY